MDDWNPSYSINTKSLEIIDLPVKSQIDRTVAKSIVEQFGDDHKYNKHYYPNDHTLKIFIKSGSIIVDLNSKEAFLEKLKRRQVFYQVNFLHYNNPKKLWTWFSDIFCVAMIIISITGLILLKGKNGFKRRGWYFVVLGIVFPAIVLLMYL